MRDVPYTLKDGREVILSRDGDGFWWINLLNEDGTLGEVIEEDSLSDSEMSDIVWTIYDARTPD
jgi:hypothetical protein